MELTADGLLPPCQPLYPLEPEYTRRQGEPLYIAKQRQKAET